jgi:hypothetical protein
MATKREANRRAARNSRGFPGSNLRGLCRKDGSGVRDHNHPASSAELVKHQNCSLPDVESGGSDMTDMRLGAEILRLVLAYEELIHKGTSRTEAAHILARQNKSINPEFFPALVTLDPNAEEGEIRKCRIEQLSPGMIIQHEIRTYEGALLVSKGQDVTSALMLKLKNFHARRAITGEVTVSLPATKPTFMKGAS